MVNVLPYEEKRLILERDEYWCSMPIKIMGVLRNIHRLEVSATLLTIYRLEADATLLTIPAGSRCYSFNNTGWKPVLLFLMT